MEWNLGSALQNTGIRTFSSTTRLDSEFNFGISPVKTMFVTVTCENKCAIEILPFNVGLEYLPKDSNIPDDWGSLGQLEFDQETKQISMSVYLPDNYETVGRATCYPEYTTKFNTGTGNFTVPIILPNTHPLCKCGK